MGSKHLEFGLGVTIIEEVKKCTFSDQTNFSVIL
jgi:hypothetical protein